MEDTDPLPSKEVGQTGHDHAIVDIRCSCKDRAVRAVDQNNDRRTALLAGGGISEGA